jgi:phosphatidylglycerophosphate synthase
MSAHADPEAPAQPGYTRPVSIEERSNKYLIHPLSDLAAKAAIRLGVTANQVSVLGLSFGWLGAVAYHQQPDRLFVACGFAAMIAWHILDGADGRVARMTGTSSAFGRVIDGICDHLVFAAVYLSLGHSMVSAGAPAAVWLLIVAAGASHAVQAAAYEERRQRYQRRLKGVQRDEANKSHVTVNSGAGVLAKFYDGVQRIVAGDASILDDALSQQRRAGASDDSLRSHVEQTAPIVRRWSILNANNRTLMIALAAFIGHPAFYFLYEIIILNAALVFLVVSERAEESKIAEDISPPSEPN